MRRHPKAGGRLAQTRRRKTVAPKRRNTPKITRHRGSSAAGLSEQVAQFKRERDEALEQQAATADVLKVISRSTFDLQTIFDTLVKSAARLCHADKANISLLRDGRFQYVAGVGFSPEHMEYMQSLGLTVQRGSISGRSVVEGRIVHVPDVLADAEFAYPEAQKLGSFRTALGVPLLREGAPIGAMFLTRATVDPFSQQQIDLVTNFAAQAVIAIENTRLLNELRQRTDDLSESLEQQTATAEVLKVISSSPGDLDTVFDAMLANAVRICEASFGVLFRFEDGAWRAAAMFGVPPAFAEYWRRGPQRPSPRTALGRVVETKQTVHIADVTTEPAYVEGEPIFVAAVNLGRFRTILNVPLLKENGVIGCFAIYRQEVRPFSNKQIELVQNFASQAVIAIENARLLNELREALQQQTATSEVLSVISSSPGELSLVFRAMLDSAVRICEAKYGKMFLYDGKEFRAVGTKDLPTAWAEFLKHNNIPPHPVTPLGRALITKQVVHIADIRTDDGYIQRHPGMVAVAELGGARTLMTVPMLKENEVVGAIGIYRQEVRPFTDKQIALVQNFAAQAVIAIENARLLSELRSRTNELAQSVGELQALGEVSQAVNSTLDLKTVLTTIVGRAVQLSRTDAGAIYVFDEERKEFRLHATHGMSENMIVAITDQGIGLGDARIGAATAQRKPIQVADIRNEPTSPVNEIVLREGYRGILVIPLLRPDHIVGALVVRRKTPGEFANSTIDLLQTFADQSVVAIQNARLFESVEARTRELGKSLEDLRTAQDRLVQTSEACLAWPTDCWHRARDQEPAQLRQ